MGFWYLVAVLPPGEGHVECHSHPVAVAPLLLVGAPLLREQPPARAEPGVGWFLMSEVPLYIRADVSIWVLRAPKGARV